MTLEGWRFSLIILVALLQIGVIIFGSVLGVVHYKISTKDGQGIESRLDTISKSLGATGTSTVDLTSDSDGDMRYALNRLAFPETKLLIDRLRTQRKLLKDAYDRTREDSIFSQDLSNRLNCLIGIDEGLLYLVSEKVGVGLVRFDKADPEKKLYDVKTYYNQKNFRVTHNNVESVYSMQDVVNLMATLEGGARVDVRGDPALEKLISGVHIAGYEAGIYILLRTADDVLVDVDRLLIKIDKYYIKPSELFLLGEKLRTQGDYLGAIQAFEKARAILSEYRNSNSPSLIQVEGALAMVYLANKEYGLSLEHAEKSVAMLGDKEWTGNLAPICIEGVALALLKKHIPNQTNDAKDAYHRSISALNEAIRLKKKNVGYSHTQINYNYESIAQANLFLGDFVSALDAIDKAIEIEPCQMYSILKGMALLGLEHYPEANAEFQAVRATDSMLTDMFVDYSNKLASGQVRFSMKKAWHFIAWN